MLLEFQKWVGAVTDSGIWWVRGMFVYNSKRFRNPRSWDCSSLLHQQVNTSGLCTWDLLSKCPISMKRFKLCRQLAPSWMAMTISSVSVRERTFRWLLGYKLTWSTIIDNPGVHRCLIGVRITFYLQIILTAIIALLPGADFIGSSWGISATFWALFFCSIIQWSQDKYTLFQAIITSYLLYLHALASTLCAVPCYARPIGRGGDENSTSPMILISVALSHLASGIFGIFTAIKGSSMGPSVECNDSIRLQILFFRLKPAGSHRWILLTFAILYLGICCTFQCFQLAIWVKKGRPFTPNWLVLTWKHFSNDPNVVNMIGKSTNEDLENRLKNFLMIGGAIWWLSILNIELTIRINEVDTPSASGFGQVREKTSQSITRRMRTASWRCERRHWHFLPLPYH